MTLALFGSIALILLAFVINGAWLTAQVRGNGQAIDLAGSQRYSLYQTVDLLHRALDAPTPEQARLMGEVGNRIDRQREVYDALRAGNPKYGIADVSGPDVDTVLGNTVLRWQTEIEPLFNAIIAMPPAERPSLLAELDKRVDEFVGRDLNASVAAFAGQQENALQRFVVIRYALVVLGILLLLAAFLYVHRWLLAPVAMLIDDTTRIAEGNYALRTAVDAPNELGILASRFNRMTAVLDSTIRGLASTVEERTRALDASQKRLQALIDNAPDAIVVVRAEDDGILLFSRGAERMFGYHPDEVAGQPPGLLVPDWHAGTFPGGTGMIARRKDGTTLHVDVTVGETIIGTQRTLTTIIRDVSARIETEQALAAKNRELARANRLKSEFLASMSHELRTPLNAIIGFSELLRDGLAGPLSARQVDYIGEVYQSGRHLLSLINDILDLSKVEAGKMALHPEPLDPNEVIDNAITLMRGRATDAGITLTKSVAPDVGMVVADGRKVRQIVYNLLSNAVKFTRGGGNVQIAAAVAGRDLEIAVTDTGIGIAPEDQGRLFRPFEQLDGGVDRQYEGTGLGLAMVKSLVELHGGTLGVESEPGRGSRFWVRLPLGQELAPGSSPGMESPSTRDRTADIAPPIPVPADDRQDDIVLTAPDSMGSILVVDEDPNAREQLRLYLESAGYRVIPAASAEDALGCLKHARPDLVTLDLRLPGMSGLSLLTNTAGDRTLSGIPVLVVSGAGEPERALGVGAHALLCKPVRRHELLESVSRLMAQPPPGQASRVLVADDDPRAVTIVTALLSEEDIDVVGVYGGQEALDAIERHPPDLVILDLMMPGVSGFEVLARLRTQESIRHIPVIILTAKTLSDRERESLASGAQSVLRKTTGSQSLLAEVRRLLAMKAAPQPGSRGTPA